MVITEHPFPFTSPVDTISRNTSRFQLTIFDSKNINNAPGAKYPGWAEVVGVPRLRNARSHGRIAK